MKDSASTDAEDWRTTSLITGEYVVHSIFGLVLLYQTSVLLFGRANMGIEIHYPNFVNADANEKPHWVIDISEAIIMQTIQYCLKFLFFVDVDVNR